jgi:hypothetical protein
MATRIHTFDGKAPSHPTLRKLLRADEKAGATLVIFERGEQCSTFEKMHGRWYHRGNGLLKAGYKLADELDAIYFSRNK